MNYSTNIIEFDSIGSTNKWCYINHPHFNKDCIYVITANTQTDGVGRGINRKWESDHGGIYMSVVVKLFDGKVSLNGINILSAVIIKEILELLGIPNIMIKWPNDIILNNKKIGGILTEIHKFVDYQLLVIGIGINNTNNEVIKISRPLFPPSTIFLESGKSINKGNFISKFIEVFQQKFAKLNNFKNNNISTILSDFDKCNILKNKKITLKDDEEIFEGKFHSLSSNGYLNLNINGNLMNFISGDIISIK